jgi:hypothetical protein
MRKPFTRLTSTELREATAEFDKEFIVDSFGDPPTELMPLWARAVGEAQSLEGSQEVTVVRVGLERELLARSDRLARDKGLSRANLIARGLKAVLVAEGEL